MNIRDLSIGDWVRNPATGSHYKITATFLTPMGEMLTAQVDGNGKEIRCFSENIEPIPLTPEILEKNGFRLVVKNNIFDEWRNPPITIRKYNFENNYRLFVNGWAMPFKMISVHQLQHALRLSKVKKDIIL